MKLLEKLVLFINIWYNYKCDRSDFMNSREDFLKSLRVNNTSGNKRKNRYIADIKAEEMAKKQDLRKKVAALIMAGGIIGVSTASLTKNINNYELQHTTNPHQIEMVNESQSNIPIEIYLPRKTQYDQLQKDIAEYKKLDSIIFKTDNEKKRFAELQSNLTKQEKIMNDFSLDLIKYRVAQDFGIENYSDLVIKPGFEDGETLHRVVNKNTKQTLYCDQLNEPTLDAISDIANYQSIRNRYLPYDEIPQDEKDARISKLVVKLNDDMMKFNKDMLKIFYPKNNASKQVAMKKNNDMER